MAMELDPEVGRVMAAIAEAAAGQDPPKAGDWQTRRVMLDALLGQLDGGFPEHGDLEVKSHWVPVEGAEIEVRQFTAAGAKPSAAVLYLHGGGMIAGTLDVYDRFLRDIVARVPEITVLAPEYRLAPEHPHPVPVEDGYAALCWLADRAAELGVRSDRLAVAGDSAGGGLAAGVALLARERGGPALARQMLIYPMLDDRTTTVDAEIAPFLVWSYDDNVTGWQALLGDAAGGETVPASAAPARADALHGSPRTYIEVGELDLFRDEDVLYGLRLAANGIPVELHLHPDVPHAFEHLAPGAGVSQRAFADRARFLRGLIGGDG